MRKYLLLALTLGLATGAWLSTRAQTPSAPERIALESVTNGSYTPLYIYGVRPLPDGGNYAQVVDDGRRIVASSFANGQQNAVLFSMDELADAPFESIDGYMLSPDQRTILLQTNTTPIYRRTFSADYFLYDRATKQIRPLSEGGAQTSPLFSPDSRHVAFVRDNNLHLVSLADGRETAVTTDGERNAIINGLPDWVYEEEFSTARSFEFTADGRFLCWLRYDESRVPIYKMTMYKGLKPELEENDAYPGSYDYKYPVAGEVNSVVTLHRYDLASGERKPLPLPMDADGYIPRIVPTSDPARLAVVTLNRHQNRMDLYMVRPLTGEAKLALHETNERYLREQAYTAMRFYKGHFAMLSERSGYQHLYWYDLDGRLVATITKGDYEVSQLYGYDEKARRFYFAAHKDSPLQTAIYSADLKGRLSRLTPEGGTHSATFSSDFRYFMNVHSSLAQPPVTTLRDQKGRVLTTLIDNAKLRDTYKALGAPQELFQFTTAEGVQLNGWMMKPRNFDPSRRYPVVMYQYSGPGSQEVADAWSNGFYPGGWWESYLAQEGFISVIVDGRGTGARGADFEKCTYLRLGDLESRDQVAAAQYLASLPFVDAERIAIWGWSFGGFNTMMAMSDGGFRFRCGVAVAAPSNWKYYDTVYTERYMRTPKENPNYDEVCPIGRAEKLEGNLLLMHGTADDNVHFRNCTEMSEALVQAGKPFEMQVYTNRNHGIHGGKTRWHLFGRMFEFLKRQMK